MDTRDIYEELGVYKFDEKTERLIEQIREAHKPETPVILIGRDEDMDKARAVVEAAGMTVKEIRHSTVMGKGQVICQIDSEQINIHEQTSKLRKALEESVQSLDDALIYRKKEEYDLPDPWEIERRKEARENLKNKSRYLSKNCKFK